MEKPRSYWQQQYANSRPPQLLRWCAAHLRLIQALCGLMLALAIGDLVWAALEGDSLVSPILNVITWFTQVGMWNYWFPRSFDGWAARQDSPAAD